ncbi:MAG TPA: bifunctional GTP diphosphokinase/guanosine-3',5'-bis pyrophosphate 3'-pyrophosphohydrolase [Pseudomonadales bacterium]
MQTIDHLTDYLNSYLDTSQIDQVRSAYYFAKEAHEGQYRRSGEPYITHPLAVSYILADMHMDHQSLMAAMLHDVIEDTPVAKAMVAEQFGETVAELVDGVSKISQIKFESQAIAQAENFRKMVLAMTQDIRVILVKLADRLHNMRTLDVLQPKKRRRIATETLEIYSPIANRLGMNNMRIEFEDLGFSALYPMRSELIKKALKKAKGNRTEIIQFIEQAIHTRMEQDDLQARVFGREKHLYSIYQKMRDSRKSFKEIMDVFGFRIVVNSVDACYRALGIIHNLYKPIPGRFKDYIAIPKTNGYQSLHTTLIGTNGIPIEIQIRTEAMEAMANNGIAAHWLYKSEGFNNAAQTRAREWLKSLLDLQQRAGNSLEFIEHVKVDLFPDEVYIFTPRGKILVMPTGATPVDFAYAVHSGVGDACVAAKIDHRLVPLSTPLKSGQTVEIITAPGSCPNPTWLSFVITSKARSNIRHFLKTQRTTDSIELGKRLLDKALASLHTSLDKIPLETIDSVLKEAKFNALDDLLADIGLGNRMPQFVARHLMPIGDDELLPNPLHTPLAIRGTEGMVINYGKCCRPIPGDNIVGYLSSGRGMVIHQDTCNNVILANDKPDKLLAVEWSDSIEGEFIVELRIEMENQRGALAVMATVITDSDANIESIHMEEKDVQVSVVKLFLGVKNRVHLARVIKRLRNLKAIYRLTRVKT